METGFIFRLLQDLLSNQNQILLKIDPKGVVREALLGRQDTGSWTSFSNYRRALEGRPVRDFFEMPDKTFEDLALRLKSAEEALDAGKLFHRDYMYPSKNIFEGYEKFYEFYSLLPNSMLYVVHAGRLGFVGIVRFSQVKNVIEHFRHHPLIILGADGRLQALNRCFLGHFSRDDLSADSLLGDAIRNRMSENPIDTLAGGADRFAGLREEKWEDLFSLDFSGAPTRKIREQVETRHLVKKAGACFWNPPDSVGSFLPLLKPLNTGRLDLRVSLDFETGSGLPPAVIVNGAEDYAEVFPDYNGYLLGPDISGDYFQVKKEGQVVHSIPAAARLDGGVHTVEIIKRGVCLAYFLDGKPVIGYRDPVLYTHPRSFQYFLSRRDKAIRLRSLSVRTLPGAENLFHGFNEVSLRSGKENAFYYLPLVSDVFHRKGVLHYAFILYDISLLKKNIALLQESQKKVSRERDRYKAMALGKPETEKTVIGESPAMLQLGKEAQRAADSAVTVLIEGETGTGKEVLARFIHGRSPYAKGPFVKVDSSAIPQTLLESELFGVEKGAFTGAAESRPGKLESAAGGTLFLDELSNLSLSTQAKLLQFLQDFALTRLGSNRAIQVDTRVIAATNVPLKNLVDEGRFREDLYYRLTAVRFSIPPLRDRREDIGPLCAHFLRLSNEKLNRGIKGFAPEAHRKLLSHGWPGNVRELENVVQKAVMFCDNDVIGPDGIELPEAREAPAARAREAAIPRGDPRMMTREHILELLRRNNNIIERAVRDARIGRATFFNKLKKFGIRVAR